MERFFLTILIMQMLCYGIVDYYKIKYGRFSVLSIFLILFLVVFPIHFQIGGKRKKILFFVYTIPSRTLKFIGILVLY
jgi:hypothetical protein